MEDEKIDMTERISDLMRALPLVAYGALIPKQAYEDHFRRTRTDITFTFAGHGGESKTSKIIRTDLPGFEDLKFVKVGRALYCIDEEDTVNDPETGEKVPTAKWIADVQRQKKQ